MTSVESGRLAGKVTIITGSARGIGATMARMFAAEGASVLVTDILDELGETTAQEIVQETAGCSSAPPTGLRMQCVAVGLSGNLTAGTISGRRAPVPAMKLTTTGKKRSI